MEKRNTEGEKGWDQDRGSGKTESDRWVTRVGVEQDFFQRHGGKFGDYVF